MKEKLQPLIRKVHVADLLRSPSFYFIFSTHLFSLYLIFINNLEYFYIFHILYLEIIIDSILLFIVGLFMKNEHVQQVFNSNKHNKFFLISRSLFITLFVLFIISTFVNAFIFDQFSEYVNLDSSQVKVVFWAIGTYFVIRLLNLCINFYKSFGTKEFFARKFISSHTTSMGINMLTLFLLFMPGMHIILFLGLFIKNMPMLAIMFVFLLRAYLDSAVAVVIELNPGILNSKNSD